MIKKILLILIALIVALLLIGCGKDAFDRDDVEVKAYIYTVHKGDYMDDILGTFYERNTVFVDWASYRQKHFDLNAELLHTRGLRPGDKVIVYTVHKKGEKK